MVILKLIEFHLDNMKTKYASAERTSKYNLQKQVAIFKDKIDLVTMAESVDKMVVILNKQRQIVYANNLFLETIDVSDFNFILGKRTGEAINCTHSIETEGGCGTTEFCETCGAVNAILESHKGCPVLKECRITTIDNIALDLRVNATPFFLEEEQFTIFAISDISFEKRKQMLERVFFHDVLNSAGGISGLSSIMKEINDRVMLDKISTSINRASNNLIEEIKAQSQLSSAEHGDLELNISNGNSLIVLAQLRQLYTNHEVNADKKIIINPSSESVSVKTDLVLLRRILGNMTKNAIEASFPNSPITLACFKNEDKIRFSVHNLNFMPRDIQLQLFNRSYTTKGVGRGIGTYSMKLFGEKYLKGKVWFESNETTGTFFYLEIQS